MRLLSVILCFFIIFSLCYLQYGREIDASGSYYSGDTLSFNVTLNRLWFNSFYQESIKRNILKKYSENSFHSTRFSTDLQTPKQINVSIYLNEKEIQRGEPLFIFSTDI